MRRERDDSFDLANDDDQYEEDEDPWFKSIKQEQIKMREKQQ